MKTLFSTRRLLTTFFLYVIIIIIPLGVMMYVGTKSLEDKRLQIEENVRTSLIGVGDGLSHDLFTEWESFMRRELLRKYYHYQPVTLPDDPEIISNELVWRPVRSSLNFSMNSLSNLSNTESGEGSPSRPSVSDIIANSLVGYFSYDPQTGDFTTPYDPSTSIPQRHSSDGGRGQVLAQNFRSFLEKHLKPPLLAQLGLDNSQGYQPTTVLRYVRATLISKEKETRSKFEGLSRLASDLPMAELRPSETDATLWVYYYDYGFKALEEDGNSYVVGFRPVLIDKDHLMIQGFLINTVVLIQEAQSYLENLQTDFGSVVLERSNQVVGQALFDPFSSLRITYKTNEDKGYLRNFYEDQRRFYITMICLTIALAFSMVHMGTLIHGHVDLNRKKNNFISAITHELKAPLTSIMMYAEMLEEGWARGKEQTYYQHIRWESERLSRLIRNILDFSGLERGTFKLQRAHLELDVFVMDTLDSLQDWMDKNGLKLDLKIDASPLILADKDSLSQVLYNLCDNALKYGMSNESPLLTVQLTELEDNAILTIFDNGAGVPKEESTKVFRKFYRIENEMTRESTGTGLGLALVKDLVEGNGGKIEYFRPFLDHGFGMRIYFPLQEDDDLEILGQEFA